MANFNASLWYHLYNKPSKADAFIGTNLNANNGNAGAVFWESTNTTRERQRWQLYAVNETYYMLRTQAGGANAFLGAMFSADETTYGNTTPHMIRGSKSDESVFWEVSPWGDGTFFITNKRNGTGWHLARKPSNGLAVMDLNTPSEPQGEQWNFEQVGEVQTDEFSTLNLPGMTATSAFSGPSPTDSPLPSSTLDSPSSHSGGMSTGTKAAIGGAVGGVVLIALIILGLFFWRRRKWTHRPPVETAIAPNSHPLAGPTTKYELNHDDTTKYEMQDTQFAELPQTSRPVEMEGNMAMRGYNGR